MLCQNPIPTTTILDRHGKAMANTYCMRPMGHKGECNPQPTEEDLKQVSSTK